MYDVRLTKKQVKLIKSLKGNRLVDKIKDLLEKYLMKYDFKFCIESFTIFITSAKLVSTSVTIKIY